MFKIKQLTRDISEFSKLSINTLRMLSADAIAKAKSGHTGIALGAAPIVYALFRNHLNINPEDPAYFNRDRFILSAGHGSALLYSAMLISGYKSITMDDLKQFRQLNSKCPGHPENHILQGVEVGTGPLGQGIAMGVGMALTESFLANKFNRYSKFIDHYTYVLFGDGCLQEGVAQEAIALAGKLKLNKLILLYDSNRIQLDGKVSDSTNFDVRKLFKAYDWNYIKVRNGDKSSASITNAIAHAKQSSKPTIIEVSTTIGFGCRLQNTNACHGVPLSEEQLQELRENLDYKIPPFEIHPSVWEDMKFFKKRGVEKQRQFNLALQRLENKDIALYNEYIKISKNNFQFSFDWYKNYQSKPETATRTLMSDALQPLLENNNTFLVGTADLSSSTQVLHKKSIAFTNKTKYGQNINYGVREFAMACINNGINAHGGSRALTSTFLAFSDYNKNAIRLAAISYIPSINIYSHDTITVGEDGPTHQPIEQIPSLRLIPNHFLFRPANFVECVVALNHAINTTTAPTTIITSRGNFKQYPSEMENAKHGGYVIHSIENHQLNIIATGSEVAFAIEVSKLLQEQGINARVVSMLSVELFEMQGSNYKQEILDSKPTVSIEFAATAPWHKYADFTIGIDQFGKSSKPNDLLTYLDLTPAKITDKILTWYKSLKENK